MTARALGLVTAAVLIGSSVAWAFAQYVGPHAAELFYVAALACGFHVPR